MFQKAVLFLILVSQPALVPAQGTEMLILEKLGHKKREVYVPGDMITMKLEGEKQEFSGTITGLLDSTIIIEEDIYVDIENIRYVKTEHTEGFLSPSNGPKLIIAGIALLLIDQLNHSVIQGNEFRIPEGIAITSGALIVTGAVWTSFRYRKFRPGKNRRIRILRL